MKLIALLLLMSCANAPKSNVYYKTYRHEILGASCPHGYYYSFSTELCQPNPKISHQNAPDKEIKLDSVGLVQSSVKRKKTLKTPVNESTECVMAISKMKMCGIGGLK